MDPSSAGRLLLLVDRDPDALAQLRATLRDANAGIREAHSDDDARRALASEEFDCVIVTADAPLLDELLAGPADAPPVIVLAPDVDGALDAMRRGAFDGLVEGATLAIVRAVRHAIELHATRRRADRAERRDDARRNLAPVGHFELDAALVPTYVNEHCHELCGLVAYDADSFRRALRAVPKDELPTVFAELEKLRAGEPVHIQHRMISPDGQIRWVDTRCASVKDGQGNTTGVVGTVQDITEQRATELRERTTRAQLEAIVEHAPSAMWFKDLDRRYVFVNPQFAAMAGRDPADFPGATDEEVMPAEIIAVLRERDLTVLTSGEAIEFEDELVTPAGPRHISSVAFPVFDAAGEPIGICGLADDATDRQASEDRFRRSFDDAPVGMILARPDGSWQNVNKAMADLLGYDRNELLDRHFSEFTHPEDREEDERRVAELLRHGGTMSREKRVIRRDGSIIWVLSCIDIARDHAGRPLWGLVHVLDITQRKRAEHELQRQQVDMLTIARVARDAGGAENPGHEVCEVAAQIVGAVNVGLLEARGSDRLILTAAVDPDAPLGLEKKFSESPLTAGLAASSRERLFIGDLGDVLSQNWGPNLQARSAVYEPILRGSELLGVLSIAWGETRQALTARESSVIRLLAAEMATIIERARLTRQLRELARTDPLTGLANRRVWDERIEIELTHAKRFSNPICIALLDLDHFKPYNDTYGHQAGDRLLSAAAAAWCEELRGGDLMARVGGDEFALLLPDCTLDGGQALVERLRIATPAGVGCSVGIVQWDGDEAPLEAIARADAALYAAKESGRARSVAG
jgi:diguanylate cyclase (GGDEF)-like protein/PAS domain S-box-containing protein